MQMGKLKKGYIQIVKWVYAIDVFYHSMFRFL